MMNRMGVKLVLGMVMVAIMSQNTYAKTGGFVQTSFISTDGGIASAAAESSVLGLDGIKRGECSYTSSQGDSIKIKYEEGEDGQIIKGKVEGGQGNLSLQASLAACRESISKLQLNLSQETEAINERIAQFDDAFQNQMDEFNRQQQQFLQQQTDFLQQMSDFTRKMWTPQAPLPDKFARRYHGFVNFFSPFNFTSFF